MVLPTPSLPISSLWLVIVWKAELLPAVQRPLPGENLVCQPHPLASAVVLALVVPGPEAVLFGVTHNGSS